MKRLAIGWMLGCLVAVAAAQDTRDWKSADGKTITATLARVEGDKAVLTMNGREYPVPLARLSTADQAYIADWQKQHADAPPAAPKAAGGLTLLGQPLTANGKVQILETDLSKDTAKALRDKKPERSKLKLGIALPSGFDPAKPQKVLWVSGAINNDGERKGGNIGVMGSWAPAAVASGYMVIGVDTDQGNAREEDNIITKGDMELHHQAIDALEAQWPGFKQWQHAAAGHSGGAKSTFFRIDFLLAAKMNVIGGFFSGVNENKSEDASTETRVHRGGVAKVCAWVSSGTGDKIATPAMAEAVSKGIDSAGYRKVRFETFEGAHVINQGELKKALAWFEETAKEKK